MINYKKEIIIDLETSGLDPLKDRILAVGIKTEECEAIFTEAEERDSIQGTWDYLKKFEYFRLIGFNISFDVRFLIVRSLLHKITVVDIWNKSVDLRWLLSHDKYAKGRLEDYGEFLGIGGKYNGFQGAHAQILWQKGNITELVKYLQRDLELTYELYKRCREIGLL